MTIENTIVEKLDYLTPAQQKEVLIFIESLYQRSQQNDPEQKQRRKW